MKAKSARKAVKSEVPPFGPLEVEQVSSFNAEMKARGIGPGFDVSVQDFRDLWRLPLRELRRKQHIVSLQFKMVCLSDKARMGLQARESLYARAVHYKSFQAQRERKYWGAS